MESARPRSPLRPNLRPSITKVLAAALFWSAGAPHLAEQNREKSVAQPWVRQQADRGVLAGLMATTRV